MWYVRSLLKRLLGAPREHSREYIEVFVYQVRAFRSCDTWTILCYLVDGYTWDKDHQTTLHFLRPLQLSLKPASIYIPGDRALR